MTEGIGAEELYALQETRMKKIRVLDEKDVGKITQSRRQWDVQERWGKLQEEGIGFVCVEDARYPQKLRRISATPYALYYIAGCQKKHERVWQLSGRGQEVPMEARLRGNWRGHLHRTGWISSVAWRWGLMLMRIAEHWKKTGIPMRYWAVAWMCVIRKETGIYMKKCRIGEVFCRNIRRAHRRCGIFPQRNRIIAGLADYVIVMEARKKSGSLITADYAMEQGKEVYALPGRVTDALSEGTNHLIQQGAGIL